MYKSLYAFGKSDQKSLLPTSLQIFHSKHKVISNILVFFFAYAYINVSSLTYTVFNIVHKFGVGGDALMKKMQAADRAVRSSQHTNLIVEETGLFICMERPFTGAIPDGAISCSCCGKGILDVKCMPSLF